jgi:hypothetical protein
MPKRSCTPAAISQESATLGRGGAAAVDERERVVGRDADAAVAVAAVEAGALETLCRGR